MSRSLVVVTLFLATLPAFAADKLIALTFDDGPRPYVLYGVKSAPGLLDVLQREHVTATFFVMGWRLTPKTWGDHRYETNIGVTCIDAAKDELRRGFEIEDHTYSHVQLKTAERRKGEAWVVGDVEHGAQLIKAVSGSEPVYVRPPDWVLPDDARRDLERRGFHILTISSENPIALRDVNSLDYLCAGKHPTQCPKPSLIDSVLKQIDQRERRGVFTHILAFHELTTTTAIMPQLIEKLRARGYRFVTVSGYMREVGNSAGTTRALKQTRQPRRTARTRRSRKS